MIKSREEAINFCKKKQENETGERKMIEYREEAINVLNHMKSLCEGDLNTFNVLRTAQELTSQCMSNAEIQDKNNTLCGPMEPISEVPCPYAMRAALRQAMKIRQQDFDTYFALVYDFNTARNDSTLVYNPGGPLRIDYPLGDLRDELPLVNEYLKRLLLMNEKEGKS